MFVLLMLFLFKYIDDLIGKGFKWYVILELMFYAAATNVAMALPLSFLLSSIMTFGNLGENFELVAIKSAGVSLQRAMLPLLLLISFLSVGAFFYSDYILPKAFLKMGSLLYDVRNQKAAFLIEEGVFNNSIPGYSIRVEKKEKDGEVLKKIIIYDQTKGIGNTNVTLAKQGEMYKTEDGNYLVLKLQDGVRYEESQGDHGYDPRQRLTRLRFKQTEQKFDLSSFSFKREDESLFKNNYQMLNLKQLVHSKDSTIKQTDSLKKVIYNESFPFYRILNECKNYSKYKPQNKFIKGGLLNGLDTTQTIKSIITNARDIAKGVIDNRTMKVVQIEESTKNVRQYLVEYHKKFTLAFSCLVLFFIGAPLGAIIRKGGLGLPVVISVIFFLIYHIISTIGEKSVKEGTMNSFLGMWLAIIVLTPLGLFLTYKATADSALFDVELYKTWAKKVFRIKEKKSN
jgi:lipopolysaccharide export system permease protein